MMRKIVILFVALLASANAANFLEDRTKVSEGTEKSSADENAVAEKSDVDDVESESLDEDAAESDGDVVEAQEDMSLDEDQEFVNWGEDMEMPDEVAEDEHEGKAFLLQKPKSAELFDDDETMALAADDAVEDGTAEENTEEASEDTEEDDSAAADSSEETSNGDPSADESADSLQDPSSAESPVAETFSYDDSTTGSTNMVNVDGLTKSDETSDKDVQADVADEVAAPDEKASVDDESADADALADADAEEERPFEHQPQGSKYDLDVEETASLKYADSVEAMGSIDTVESTKAKVQAPKHGTAQLGAQPGSSALLKQQNATKLSNLLSTEVSQVAGTEEFMGEGAEAAFLAEVADDTALKQ